MTVYVGSRYERTKIIQTFDKHKGIISILTKRKLLSLPLNADVIRHRVIEKETVDFIAYKYFGDSSLWWVILDVNPQYMTPWEIKTGDLLVIPTEETLGAMLNAVSST